MTSPSLSHDKLVFIPKCPAPYISEGLLNSNEPLYGVDKSAMSYNLASLEQYLSSLDKISLQLEESRKLATGFLAKQRESVGYGRGFPTDILHAILDASSGDIDTGTSWTAPIRLASVCRTWRQAALHYRKIWCTISIPDVLTQRVPYRLLHVFLLRSGASPLNIIFRFPKKESTKHKILYRSLCFHSERWQNLSLSNIPDWMVSEVFPFPPTPALSELALSFHSSGFTLPEVIAPNIPALRSVKLYCPSLPLLGPQALPWSQVESLTLDYLVEPAEWLFDIYPMLSDLRRLEITALKRTPGQFVQNPPVLHLPQLTKFISRGPPLDILEHIHMPNVVTLNANWYDYLPRQLSEATRLQHVTIFDSLGIFDITGPCLLRSLTVDLRLDNTSANIETTLLSKQLTVPHLNRLFPHLESFSVIVKSTPGDRDSDTFPVMIDIGYGFTRLCREREFQKLNGLLPSPNFLSNMDARFLLDSPGTADVLKELKTVADALECVKAFRIEGE